MAETLEQVKDRVSKKYLGKAGIHSVGLRRSQGTITVYYAPSAEGSQSQILEELSKEAHPFKVLVLETEPAEFL
jgi:hypothetical protein